MTFSKVIFGDNQFLGVNHSDQAKAALLDKTFSESNAIIEVLGSAYEAGIRDFMFTTHDRYNPVFEEIIRSGLFPDMHYTPCLPYAHKYANAMAEQGMISVVWSVLRQLKTTHIAPAFLRSLTGNFNGIMRLLVEVELLMCKGLPVRGVFLQNVVFDLLLAIGATRLIEDYHQYVSEKLQVMPGFISMNHPKAVSVLCDEIGLEQPWLCANFNLSGFRTNPSQADVEKSFSAAKTRNIAMSVFSFGATSPVQSLDYVLRADGIDAVLFGSSNPKNINQNSDAIFNALH